MSEDKSKEKTLREFFEPKKKVPSNLADFFQPPSDVVTANATRGESCVST